MEFLFRADDQVEQMQGRLQLARHLFGFNEPAFAHRRDRPAPEVRAVVDIECGEPPYSREIASALSTACSVRGLDRCVPVTQTQRARRQNRIDIVFRQRHVGAVLAVEDQRKLVFVADTEKDQCGQPFLVRLHAAHIDALAHQLLADEAAHMLIADAGDQRRLQTEPRSARRDIGRGATRYIC